MPKVTVDMPDLPDGWEYTGEYRLPKKGDHYFTAFRGVSKASFSFKNDNQLIVKRKKWAPRTGEVYWFIRKTSFEAASSTFDPTYSSDNQNSFSGNYFRTKETAEWVAKKFKDLLEEAQKLD